MFIIQFGVQGCRSPLYVGADGVFQALPEFAAPFASEGRAERWLTQRQSRGEYRPPEWSIEVISVAG